MRSAARRGRQPSLRTSGVDVGDAGLLDPEERGRDVAGGLGAVLVTTGGDDVDGLTVTLEPAVAVVAEEDPGAVDRHVGRAHLDVRHVAQGRHVSENPAGVLGLDETDAGTHGSGGRVVGADNH